VITDRRALGILDVLLALAVLPQPLLALELFGEQPARAIVYLLLVSVLVGLWIYWRRRPRVGWVPTAMVVVSLIANPVGDGPWPLLLASFSLIIVVVLRGPWAGALVTAAVVGSAVLNMIVTYRQGAAFIAVQTAASLFLLGVVWLVAALIRLFVVASHEARQAHEALAASVETQKELLIAQERARGAGELHDGLGHRLTAIGLLLSGAQRLAATNPDRAWQSVDEARRAAGEALQEMRIWVRALHPVGVDALSEAESFAEIADRFRGTGLDVQVDARVDKLAPTQALVVRRCIQEGLTNVVRHAHARQVRLVVRQDADRVRVEIADDGAGLAEARPGFGLTELRRRVEELGGTLTSGTSALGGASLKVEVPV
jgi:signal transduction histidine kinase